LRPKIAVAVRDLRIKADRLGIPIKVLDDAETTVAGAAMFGWYGVGEWKWF
jgi:L-fuculokinase